VSKETGLEGGASSTINSGEELLRAKDEVWGSFDAAAETSTDFSAFFLASRLSTCCLWLRVNRASRTSTRWYHFWRLRLLLSFEGFKPLLLLLKEDT